MQTGESHDSAGKLVFVAVIITIVAGLGTVFALVPMGSSLSSTTSTSISTITGGCIGIAAVAPSVAVSGYGGYDIWTIPFSGILCPGQSAAPTYAVVTAGTPISTSQGFNSGAIIQGGFTSVASAEAAIDARTV